MAHEAMEVGDAPEEGRSRAQEAVKVGEAPEGEGPRRCRRAEAEAVQEAMEAGEVCAPELESPTKQNRHAFIL